MDNDKYIGRLLDNRYEILEVIGTGGMAVVYKARCHRLNRFVAIKILKDDLSQDEEFRRRFHAESQAVAMLSHPNIMSVYDVSTTDEADYIVMELIDGITLKQYMEKKGVLNWKETLHFGMQIAKALEHAHSRGIVHRDIKPHNVMVLKNGSVKVTDFGIARIMSKSNTLTKEALGSVHYISPEQAKGGRVDARSDLYSLGVVMYEMMTGRPPYDGESPVSVAIQHINGTPPMPSMLNPNLPGGLEQIIMKAMEKDPAKRYANATQMLYDLEEFRKNPSILFDFKSGSIDDALMMNVKAPVSQEPVRPTQPRTTAERIAGVRTQRPVNQNHSESSGRGTQPLNPSQQRMAAQNQRPGQQRPAGQNPRSGMPNQANHSARSRQAAEANRPNGNAVRQQREEQAESRNRTMTIAVVTCSTIAVIGIIIFLVLVFNGGVFGHGSKPIPVPNLVGQVFSELDRSKYPDVKITFVDFEYDANRPEGTIIRQKPESSEKVAPGTEIKVWVSMGPEATEGRKMDNLVEMTKDAALDYLNKLDLGLVPMVRQENSDEVKEGLVTRTSPAQGEPLSEGQTITIYISTGPAVKSETVPNVVGMNVKAAIKTLAASGFEKTKIEKEQSTKDKDEVLRLSVDVNTKVDVTTEITIYVSEGFVRAKVPAVHGMSIDEAKRMLNQAGFSNIKVSYEDNDAQKNSVIRQSISADVEVDTSTEISLTVSNGPKATEPPKTEPPATEAPKETTKDVTIKLDDDIIGEHDDPFQVTIKMNGKTLYDALVDPETESIVVKMTGKGIQSYTIYINNEPKGLDTVNFGG